MTAEQLIILDHAAALLTAAAWIGAGAAAGARRPSLALGVLAAAVPLSVSRVVTVILLADHGWWFVQEKVLLGLPMLGVAGLAAALIATPRLRAAHRAATTGDAPGPLSPGSVISLLTAGYAAFAGLLVTLLAGYPLTWSTALLTVALVTAAGLMTLRVVWTPATGTAAKAGSDVVAGTDVAAGSDVAAVPDILAVPDIPAGTGVSFGGNAMARLSRRRLFGLAGGAIAASTGVTGVGLLFLPAESVATGGGPGRSISSRAAASVADLRGPNRPARGGTRQTYEITAQTATVRLRSGRELAAWTYGGQVPGPPITATEGDLIEVTLRNADIDDGVTLHWHGYDVPCGEDGAPGVTQDVVAAGEEFVYRFRADQVGTYWYHTHQASHRGVRRGLYGTLVVTPREPAGRQEPATRQDPATRQEQGGQEPTGLDLTLPVHTFDGTVVIADRDDLARHSAPPGTPVRLRLINTDSDPHRLALAGTPFRVAAVDGRDLHQPDEVDDVALSLPAGGRYDLVFPMPDAPVALVVDNDHDGGVRLHPGDGENDGSTDDDGGSADSTTNDDADTDANADTAPDTAGWPDLDLLHYGTPTTVPFDLDTDFDRSFTLVLDRSVAMVDGGPAYGQTVNGRGHPSIPDMLVAEGDLATFTVVNRSLETHPWHLHGHPVLILARDGEPASGSPLWVDTFDVQPGEVWEVAFEATNPGIWMNHCHNLPHAHEGMMLRLSYDGVTTPFHGSHTAGGAGSVRRTSHGH